MTKILVGNICKNKIINKSVLEECTNFKHAKVVLEDTRAFLEKTCKELINTMFEEHDKLIVMFNTGITRVYLIK